MSVSLSNQKGSTAFHPAFRGSGRGHYTARVFVMPGRCKVARRALEKGAKVFCDAVRPITAKGQAVALGLATRIRLPTVPALGSGIAARLILADARYAHLHAARTERAPCPPFWSCSTAAGLAAMTDP